MVTDGGLGWRCRLLCQVPGGRGSCQRRSRTSSGGLPNRATTPLTRGSLRSCETANDGTLTVTELVLRHDSVLPHRHAEDAAGGLLEKSPRPSLRSEKQGRIGIQHAPQSTKHAEQDMDPLLASAASEPLSPPSPRAPALAHSTSYRDVGALETHLAHS